MSQRKVLIFGTTNLARHIHIHLSRFSDHEVVGFTAHRAFIDRPEFEGLEVVPFETLRETHPPDAFSLFVAVGYQKLNATRAAIFKQCKELGYSLVSYIYPKNTMIAPELVTIGENSVVLEGSTVQPGARIGDDVIIWANNVVAHDTVVEDHCFVTSGVLLGGGARIGRSSFLGLGSAIANSVNVGAENIIGAGVTILKDTEPGSVYMNSQPKALVKAPPALVQRLLLR